MGKWKLRIRPRPTQEESVPDPPVTSKSPHRSTTWRRKKRQDAEYHQIEKEKDVVRKKVARMKFKEDNSRSGRSKRKRERELQAKRQKRYRERKKAAKMEQISQPKEEEDRKSYFRSYRAKKRKEMSRQKRQVIKTKDRLRKQAPVKKVTVPLSPEKYAEFVDDLIEHSSPRKKSKLRERERYKSKRCKIKRGGGTQGSEEFVPDDEEEEKE